MIPNGPELIPLNPESTEEIADGIDRYHSKFEE